MMERIAIAPELDLMGRTGKELRALDAQGAVLKSMMLLPDAAGLPVCKRSFGRASQCVGSRDPVVRKSGKRDPGNCRGKPVSAGPSCHAASRPWCSMGPVLRLDGSPVKRRSDCFDEPSLTRQVRAKSKTPVSAHLSRALTDFTAEAGRVTRIDAPNAPRAGHVSVAGLDHDPEVKISFGEQRGTATDCLYRRHAYRAFREVFGAASR